MQGIASKIAMFINEKTGLFVSVELVITVLIACAIVFTYKTAKHLFKTVLAIGIVVLVIMYGLPIISTLV